MWRCPSPCSGVGHLALLTLQEWEPRADWFPSGLPALGVPLVLYMPYFCDTAARRHPQTRFVVDATVRTGGVPGAPPGAPCPWPNVSHRHDGACNGSYAQPTPAEVRALRTHTGPPEAATSCPEAAALHLSGLRGCPAICPGARLLHEALRACAARACHGGLRAGFRHGPHCTHTACARHAHCTHTARTRRAHSMHIARTLHAHPMHTPCTFHSGFRRGQHAALRLAAAARRGGDVARRPRCRRRGHPHADAALPGYGERPDALAGLAVGDAGDTYMLHAHAYSMIWATQAVVLHGALHSASVAVAPLHVSTGACECRLCAMRRLVGHWLLGTAPLGAPRPCAPRLQPCALRLQPRASQATALCVQAAALCTGSSPPAAVGALELSHIYTHARTHACRRSTWHRRRTHCGRRRGSQPRRTTTPASSRSSTQSATTLAAPTCRFRPPSTHTHKDVHLPSNPPAYQPSQTSPCDAPRNAP